MRVLAVHRMAVPRVGMKNFFDIEDVEATNSAKDGKTPRSQYSSSSLPGSSS